MYLQAAVQNFFQPQLPTSVSFGLGGECRTAALGHSGIQERMTIWHLNNLRTICATGNCAAKACCIDSASAEELGIYTFFFSNFSNVGIWCGFHFGKRFRHRNCPQGSDGLDVFEQRCHRWGLCGGGTYALFKEFPCYQSVARDSAITSADSHWTANHASRPGIPARILQQFAKLEVPAGIVTKAVTSHKVKWK